MAMRDTTTFKDAWQGKHGPLLIAEIGGNHEGDFSYALQLTDLAINSGVDFVKFQIYSGDSLVSQVESPDRNEHFKRFELSAAQHLELVRCCEDAGVGYMASVWDMDALSWIDKHLSIYKIGSGDLTAYPMLREFASRGKPIILSTGLSTLDEVIDAVSYIQSIDSVYKSKKMLALLQCTSMYPIKNNEANLRAMDALKEATGVSVGYSDHTRGSFALLVAAARGAQVLEFHFTDDRQGKTFRDHQVSLTQDEVQELCSRLDELSELLGDGMKHPMACEVKSGHVESFRRALYSKRDLKAGETIQESDLVILRPNHGIDARRFNEVAGSLVRRDTKAFEALSIVENDEDLF